jgi:hypothetical protein
MTTVPPPLDPTDGEYLPDETFFADFNTRFWQATEFWKLERATHFAEPHDASWQAFQRGNWNLALQLIEGRRADLKAHYGETTEHDITARRIRIVDEPIGPYLQWELHLLRLRDEIFEGTIRVLPTTVTTGDEHTYGSELPEICTMDDTVLYLHTYDEHGVQDRNIRFTDPDVVTPWRNYTRHLWQAGQPLAQYFARHVQGLPAPGPVEQLPDDYLETREKYQPGKRL